MSAIPNIDTGATVKPRHKSRSGISFAAATIFMLQAAWVILLTFAAWKVLLRVENIEQHLHTHQPVHRSQ